MRLSRRHVRPRNTETAIAPSSASGPVPTYPHALDVLTTRPSATRGSRTFRGAPSLPATRVRHHPGSCNVVPCPVPLSDVSNFERKDNLVVLCGHLAGQLHPSPLSDSEAHCRRNVTCIPIAHVRRLVYQASQLLMRRKTTGKIRDGDERRPAALWQEWDVLCCRRHGMASKQSRQAVDLLRATCLLHTERGATNRESIASSLRRLTSVH
jgi:hypothetical protein